METKMKKPEKIHEKEKEIKLKKCISCGRFLEKKGVIFNCPLCKKEIARCSGCRKLSIEYKCKCGFEGP